MGKERYGLTATRKGPEYVCHYDMGVCAEGGHASARMRSVWCRGGEPGATATHVYHLGSVALAEVVDDAGLVQKGQVCNVLDAVELWMRVNERDREVDREGGRVASWFRNGGT